MPTGKGINNDLRRTIVALHPFGMGHETQWKIFRIQFSSVRKIFLEWKVFKTVANLPRREHPSKLTPRKDCNAKRPFKSHWGCYILKSMKARLDTCGFCERMFRRKPLLPKMMNQKHDTRLHLNKPKNGRTMSYEQMRPGRSCLVLIFRSIFGENQTGEKLQDHCQAQWWKCDDLGLFCSHNWAPCRLATVLLFFN